MNDKISLRCIFHDVRKPWQENYVMSKHQINRRSTAGQLGIRYTDQCLDLEKCVKSFLDLLEYYSRLSDQPLNRRKTEALFTARAVGSSKFNIMFDNDGDELINWKTDYKYLGYIISSKLLFSCSSFICLDIPCLSTSHSKTADRPLQILLLLASS
jgi:hypothetical protein